MVVVYTQTTRQKTIINTGIEQLRKPQKVVTPSSSDYAQFLQQFENVNYGLEAADYDPASPTIRPPLQSDSHPYPTSYRGNGLDSVIVIDEALVNDVKSAIYGSTQLFNPETCGFGEILYRFGLRIVNTTRTIKFESRRPNAKRQFLLRLEEEAEQLVYHLIMVYSGRRAWVTNNEMCSVPHAYPLADLIAYIKHVQS